MPIDIIVASTPISRAAASHPLRSLTGWWIPLGLVFLGAIPALAGVLRLTSFARGDTTMADAERFASHPAALSVHIVSALTFTLVGAVQFWPALRRARPAWHRLAGRIAAPAGLLSGLSGLWAMAAYSPSAAAGLPLHAMRATVGVAMVGFVLTSLVALARGDYASHGAWMTRAYALGIAAGTQAFVLIPLTFVARMDGEASFTWGMALGWAVNVGTAEWLLRRRRRASLAHPMTRAASMNAIVYDRYGAPDELHVARVLRPSPGPGQVLVRVEATSLNAADRRMLRADPFLVRLANGLLRPQKRILGADVAGVIEAVGPRVHDRSVGERVFGETSSHGLGGFAEHVCVGAEAVAPIPAGLEAIAAASLPLAAGTALQAVRDRARVRAGQHVLVWGAGGGVGAYLVQLAKVYGATVTAVCGPRSIASVRALGADHVLDHTTTPALAPASFDAVFGVNGYRPIAEHLALLVPGGSYVMVGGESRQIFEALLFGGLRASFRGRRAETLTIDASLLPGDLAELRDLVARGALRPVVGRVMPLAQAAEAMRMLEAGEVHGKLVLDARSFGTADRPPEGRGPVL